MKNDEIKRIAFFPGSFNPFTKGHADIAERALFLFDGLIIGIGANADKENNDAKERAAQIANIYRRDPRVKVIIYTGLTVDAVKSEGACAIVRGVRSFHDYEYEINMADVNRQLEDIETILLPARPELACISSSIVRELKKYGRSL